MVDFSDKPPEYDDPGAPPPPPPPGTPAGAPSPQAPCAWHDGVYTGEVCAACRTPICRDCATPISGGEMHGRLVCPACAPESPVESSVPWESAQGRGWDTFKRSFLMPFHKQSELFTAFPARPLGTALGFAILASIPSAVLGSAMQALWSAIGLGPLSGLSDPNVRRDLPPEMVQFLEEWGTLLEASFAAGPLIGLIFVPLGVVFSALIYHLAAWIFGARHDLVTTMRIVCYLYPLNLLQAVPVLGPILMLIFWIIGMKIAMQRVNGMTPGKATTVALFPLILAVLLLCCGCIGFIMLVVAAAN